MLRPRAPAIGCTPGGTSGMPCRSTARRTVSNRPAGLLLTPTWLLLGGLFLLPLLLLIGTSIHQPDDAGNPQPVSDWRAYIHSGDWKDNYRQSAHEIYLRVALRSVLLAVATTLL